MEPKKQPGYVFRVFGLGFDEMILIGIVLIVVVGPRELPKLLRSLGRGIHKLRNMSTELRKQSGIDDIIEEEGLRDDIEAIRSLSRARIIDGVVNAATRAGGARAPQRVGAPRVVPLAELKPPEEGSAPKAEVEFPPVGCDAYGALADDAPIPEPEPPAPDEPPQSGERGPEPETALAPPPSADDGARAAKESA